jgi:tetratricopeptide (TPR) repeat protein
MPSERVQRQINGLLDEAEQAIRSSDWALVRARCQQVLALDPNNSDADAYLSAAQRGLGSAHNVELEQSQPLPPIPDSGGPTSFANGRYTVKKFLGEGGKKRVYLAHDTTLDRDVAFALIKMEGLDQTARERIAREAQAMGRLGAHPHIVTVFDLGEEPSRLQGQREYELIRQPYMVTELMGGGDVEGLIEQAPDHKLPLETALTIAEQVCQGLEFAHGQKIVHRDLKPGNVWLTADGVAKIGDFGLAVAIDKTRLTQAGMMVGTVNYMPPEQATGGEVTPRSDLYSLGAMLYEMVTGRPPFVGDEAVAIIGQHLNTPPVAPAWHRPDCPPGLETLVLRLLEKDPGKRPASAAEVRQALGLILRQAQGGRKSIARGELVEPRAVDGPVAPDNPMYRRTFVGREPEQKQLQTAFDGAVSGHGSLLMVVGEPGIGKTSLCEQLAIYATVRGGRTLVGHCYEEGSLSLPYLAFVEAMRSYVLAREPEALTKDLGSGAREVARIVSEVRERAHVEPATATSDPDEDRYRLFQAVTTFLRNAAAVQPLAIVLEDLHDADRGTLDLLLHLSRNLTGSRLLLVGTYRDIEVDRSHPLSATLAELRRGQSFSRVLLRGLTADEVQRMMSAIGGQDVRWETAEAVHRQTEGNPLFVQEVLRYLVEEGLITREDGRWQVTDSTPLAMQIPEGLRDVIGKRLARLSPDCNRLLAIAAVIGRDFRLDTLEAVANADEEAVIAAMEEATRVAVLQEAAAGRGRAIQYRFAHAFFRQTLYEELSAPRRLRIHQDVARALEAQYAGRLEEHAAELAEHFAQSTDPADLGKAVHYAELAAERATTVYAYGEAARHLEQALDVQEVLDPADKAKRCDLLLALGHTLVSLGEGTQAIEQVAPEALRFAEEIGDRARASQACRIVQRAAGQSSVMLTSEPVREWARQADSFAADGTLDRVYADIFLGLCGSITPNGWDATRALNLWRRSAQLAAELDDPLALVEASHWLLLGNAQRPEEHGERLELAEVLAKRSLDRVAPGRLANTLFYLGQALITWGRRDEAERFWERASVAAVRSRDADVAFVPLQINALLDTLDGRLESAVESGAQIRQRGTEIDRELAGRQIGSRASRRALIYLGRSQEALDGILAGRERWATQGVFATQRAMCLAHLARVPEALELLHAMLSDRDIASHDDPTPVSPLKYLLEAAVVLGDAEASAVLEGRLAPLVGLLHTEADMCYNIGRLCGGAAVLRGDFDKAMGYYRAALDTCDRVRFRPEIALTRLEMAQLLLDHYPDERAAAIDHLDFAIGEFREMKMQPALERALRHKDVLRA